MYGFRYTSKKIRIENISMTPISSDFFTRLAEGAEIIEADHYGEKVLRLRDGSFLKLFRRKRIISSEIYQPYASRFAQNSLSLKARGIPSPDVIATYKISSIKKTAVQYHPLPGQTIRQYFSSTSPERHADLCRQLGGFIANLHEQGVYFRSLHLGNIIIHEQTLGLIDIADMRCSIQALPMRKRKRNFHHLLRYQQDKQFLQKEAEHFIAGYCENTKGNPKELSQILTGMMR